MLSNPARTTSELRVRLEQMARRRRLSDAGGAPALCSGHAALDALLPGGGWPLGALTELLSDQCGIGELELLLPALQNLARRGRCLVWIAPPYVPYAPALLQRGLALERLLWIRTERPQAALWAAEQALRCPAVGAVLAWSEYIVDRSLRRLQLAAESGDTFGILHRPAAAAGEPSPAALRLQLQPLGEDLGVEIRKARGARAGIHLRLSLRLSPALPAAPPAPAPALASPATSTLFFASSDALAMHPSASTAA
ncbi:MAG TPA: translesion DNA synthesis-associated protein ImuA [Steroidobacteraceae bacterium]|nr:translesion DNA synthesis-associated protein ImuA [Steroidobacteraceae bacterium]